MFFTVGSVHSGQVLDEPCFGDRHGVDDRVVVLEQLKTHPLAHALFLPSRNVLLGYLSVLLHHDAQTVLQQISGCVDFGVVFPLQESNILE
jgi:hypothetical protein